MSLDVKWIDELEKEENQDDDILEKLYSKFKIADKLGVSDSLIDKWESGEKVDKRQLEKLSTILDV